jgi:hypothetical protein
MGYLTALMQKHARIRRWQAMALVVPGILLGLVSHVVFLT